MNPLEEKINYLKDIYAEENARQPILEGKCSQNISNSGIFLTLIGLLIGILSNTDTPIPISVKVIVVLFITSITVLNVLSIIFAMFGLDPERYRYARGNPDTVNQYTSNRDFQEEVIKDYIYCISHNMDLNNLKAKWLISSRKVYVAGIYLTGIFTIFLISYISFFPSSAHDKVEQIEIVKPVTLKK